MKWKLKNLYEEECTLEILIEENPSPLIGFLQFILINEDHYSVKLKVTRKKKETKLKEISFTFEEDDEQIITMKELTLMGVQQWMEDPVRLLKSVESHQPFLTQRALYREAEKKWDSAMQMRKIFEKEHPANFKFGMDATGTYKERTVEQERIMLEAKRKGALFPERLKDIYRDYLEKQKNPSKKPGAIAKPEHDHIEVELLTILNDKSVTQEVKVEAGVTLNRYREKKKAEKTPEENEKNNNAMIAIKTIQEHYLK